jgi:aryl-alcohol dehydrogenase-like predicted oxidoreductase
VWAESFYVSVLLLIKRNREDTMKYTGLSEELASTLYYAHVVHPISVVQVEYPHFTLNIEDKSVGLLKTAKELGVVVVAYLPRGRVLVTS